MVHWKYKRRLELANTHTTELDREAMLTQLLTTAAALLLLGAGPVSADDLGWASLARSDRDNTYGWTYGVSWGTLVLAVRSSSRTRTYRNHRGQTITTNEIIGMVCNESMDDNTADFLCRLAGFSHGAESSANKAQSVGKRINSSSWYYGFKEIFAYENLRCPAGAESLDDCSWDPIGTHDCSYNEGLVLKCRTE